MKSKKTIWFSLFSFSVKLNRLSKKYENIFLMKHMKKVLPNDYQQILDLHEKIKEGFNNPFDIKVEK